MDMCFQGFVVSLADKKCITGNYVFLVFDISMIIAS